MSGDRLADLARRIPPAVRWDCPEVDELVHAVLEQRPLLLFRYSGPVGRSADHRFHVGVWQVDDVTRDWPAVALDVRRIVAANGRPEAIPTPAGASLRDLDRARAAMHMKVVRFLDLVRAECPSLFEALGEKEGRQGPLRFAVEAGRVVGRYVGPRIDTGL